MDILALSGSLRAASENTRVLRAAARLAPAQVRVLVYSGLGELPLFNPDTEFPSPATVAALRAALNAAGAVVIASPEYAHGVSAVIKNALDWMVGNESFVNKPVALINAAPRASHAYLALRETVTMMSARVIDAACVTLAQPVTGMTEQDIAAHPRHAAMLRGMLETLAQAAHEKKGWDGHHTRHADTAASGVRQEQVRRVLPPPGRPTGRAGGK